MTKTNKTIFVLCLGLFMYESYSNTAQIDELKIQEEFVNIYHLFTHQNNTLYEMLDQQQSVLHHVSGHGPEYRDKNCKLCAMKSGHRLENKFRDNTPKVLIDEHGGARVIVE